MTIDILGELCFGKGFGALECGSTHLETLLMGAAKLTQKVDAFPSNLQPRDKANIVPGRFPTNSSSPLPNPNELALRKHVPWQNGRVQSRLS